MEINYPCPTYPTPDPEEILKVANSGEASELLFEEIMDAITTDDDSYHRKGRGIVLRYLASDEKTRNAIDDILVTITGWSLRTLLVRAKLLDDSEGVYLEPEDDSSEDFDDEEGEEEEAL